MARISITAALTEPAADALQPAAPVSAEERLADRAYGALRARILDLRLLPGQLIVEPDLAAELSMSRTPIREALARLRFEGLVTASPRRGFVVSVPTVEHMREVYEVIAGIESQAVKLAATRADASVLAQLDDALAAQEAALAGGPPSAGEFPAAALAAWTEADQRFHRLLREAAGNRLMLELMRQFEGHLHRARVATIRLRPWPRQSTDEHRAVLEAIKARDPERARVLHLAHRERADRAMLDVIHDFSGVVLRALVNQ
jgi:DNA-binding GntR family transcriptional regulator